MAEGKQVDVGCTVKNTGKRAGKEIVQLYVRDVEASLDRPWKELKVFEKVALNPGESQKINFELDREVFVYYHTEAGRWIVEPGDFEIFIGASSRDIRLTGLLKEN